MTGSANLCVCVGVCVLDLILYVPLKSFTYIGTGLPGLNQY